MRTRAIASALAVVSAAIAALIVFKSPKFETSLDALFDKESISLPDEIRRSVSSRVQAVVSSASFEEAYALAAKFTAALNTNLLSSVSFRVDSAEFPEILSFYSHNRGGLISDGDLAVIAAPKADEKVFAAIASPSPSLFAFSLDPYRFLDGFVKSRPHTMGKWQLRKGVLAAEENGIFHILISLTLFEADAFDIRRLPLVMAPIVENVKRLNAECDHAEILLSGPALHTFETSGRCEREITLLSIFSTAFVIGLVIFAIRSLKVLGLVLANLFLAMAGGFLVLALCFYEIHLLSLIFGTTLIGLTVDYSFHAILSPANGGAREVRSNLIKSYATTLISMFPLVFSGIGVLVQSAVFLISGLSASLAFNVYLAATDQAGSVKRLGAGGWNLNLRPLLIVFALVAFGAIGFVRFHTGIEDMYSPPDTLKRAEALLAKLSGVTGTTGMAVIKGSSLEEVLEKDELLAGKGGALSRFLPSLHKRRQNHRAMMDFHKRNSDAIARHLGLERGLPPPAEPKEFTLSQIPAFIAQRLLFRMEDGAVMAFVPAVEKAAMKVFGEGREDVKFYAPREMINGMLARYAEKTLVLLCVSFVLLMAVLMLLYRRRFVKIILPSVLSVLVMFAVVSLFGENVNLFHLLSSFMIIGMSLDYSIFLSGDFKRAINPVVCALLTSVAGFGALAFVSFPIVRSLGVALAIGLPVSFIAAVALFMPAEECDERAATPVGMEILWLIYRLFGKRVLDIMVMLVANFVWLSDAKARRAAKSRRRLVNFALSLGDKLSVLSMGRGQPKIRLDESGDAERFIADVAARKGVVVLSSHLGNIETLSAYGECSARFHVFMALSATGVFRAFKERHSCRSKIELHPTEGFGMAELFAGAEIVERGDVVLMAADRGGGRVKEMPFLGGKRKFPEGAFRFAHHLERPVYFVASLREAGGYRVYAKLLSGSDLLGDYVRELDRLVKMYPDQWYQWDNEKGENG